MESKISPYQLYIDPTSLEASTDGLTIKIDPSSFIVRTPGGLSLTADNVGTLIREVIDVGPLTSGEVAQGWYDFTPTAGNVVESAILSTDMYIMTDGLASPSQHYGDAFTLVKNTLGLYHRITWDPSYSLTDGAPPLIGLTSSITEGDRLVISYYRLGTTGDLTPACETSELSTQSTDSSSYTDLVSVTGVNMRARRVRFSVSGSGLQLNGNTSVDFVITMNGVNDSPSFINGMRYIQDLGSFSFETVSTALSIDGSNDFVLKWRTDGGNMISVNQLIFNLIELR